MLVLGCDLSPGLVVWVQGQRADWRAAHPCVWPASAGWGWRSLHLGLWGLASGEAEEHTSGHQVGNPGITFLTSVNTDKSQNFVGFSKTVYKMSFYHQSEKPLKHFLLNHIEIQMLYTEFFFISECTVKPLLLWIQNKHFYILNPPWDEETLQLCVYVFQFEPLWLTWHLMSMSKKSSSGSLVSALAMSWLSTSWLLFRSSSNPGSVPMLARCSSSRRPCELANKSRKWPGWAEAASSDTEIARVFLVFFLKGERRKKIFFLPGIQHGLMYFPKLHQN